MPRTSTGRGPDNRQPTPPDGVSPDCTQKGVAMAALGAPVDSPKKTAASWGKRYGLVLACAVGLAIWLSPVSGVTPTQHKLLSIFGGAIVLWVTLGVNFAVSIFFITCLLYFWVGNVAGQMKDGVLVRSTDFALSGFSAANLWLIVTGFVICIAMTNTGVAKRLLLHVVRAIGGRPFGAVMAASLTNFAIAPFTPSNTARALAMVPVVEGIAESYQVKAGESNFGRSLALSMAIANNITGSAFLTGTIPNVMFISAIIGAVGASVYTSWSYWALAAAPTNLLLLFFSGWFLLKMFPPEMTEIRGGLTRVESELAAMGPMSGAEKKAIVYFLIAVLLWATDRWHGLNATMIAFVVSSLIFMPRTGVLEWKDTQNALPWELYVYVGGVTTLSTALAQSKAVDVVFKNLFASFGLQRVPEFTLLMLLIGFTIFSHMCWSTTTSMTGVMAPIYVSIAQSMGFDVAKFCLPLAIMMAYALFFPFNTNGNIILLGTGYFTPNDLLKSSLPIGIVVWVAWLITALTWWRLIGLV
jgi:solute carrier family 13 (sodium-dependent dicarboxylate transporter), member 2/3/5